jgi:flagellar biosynthesis/type III secretory pathway protein FliH
MNDDILKNANHILNNKQELEIFADLNRITVTAAKQLLEQLLAKPEMAEEFKKYIFSDKRSDDFKGYTAGEEKGYQRGHEAGFAKGTTVGALATIGLLTLAGIAYLTHKD